MDNKQKKTENEQRYPGAAVDAAQDDKVTEKMEKQYTRELNNNPRNSDM